MSTLKQSARRPYASQPLLGQSKTQSLSKQQLTQIEIEDKENLPIVANKKSAEKAPPSFDQYSEIQKRSVGETWTEGLNMSEIISKRNSSEHDFQINGIGSKRSTLLEYKVQPIDEADSLLEKTLSRKPSQSPNQVVHRKSSQKTSPMFLPTERQSQSNGNSLMILVVFLALIVFGGTLMMFAPESQKVSTENEIDNFQQTIPLSPQIQPVDQLVGLIMQHLKDVRSRSREEIMTQFLISFANGREKEDMWTQICNKIENHERIRIIQIGGQTYWMYIDTIKN